MKRSVCAVLLLSILPLFCGETVDRTEAVEGQLVRLPKPSGRATHRIVLIVNKKEYPLAFAGSAKRDLPLWENRTVRAEGRKTWIPGSKLPYLEIERITPLQ